MAGGGVSGQPENPPGYATVYIASPSLAMTDEHGKRHARCTHQTEAVSDWLNPFSLGTMSTSTYIDNFAKNSTRLINYQELTRSI